MEGTVLEPEPYSLFEFTGSDRDFLRNARIKPCVIRCFHPRYPAVKLTKENTPRITGTDIQWLGECGVAWEPEPAVQLPLDFSGCRTKEHNPKEPVSPRKEEST
jgi:hypothetical protein